MTRLKKILISAILLVVASSCEIHFEFISNSNSGNSLSSSASNVLPSPISTSTNSGSANISISNSNSNINSMDSKPSNPISTSTSVVKDLKTLSITSNIDVGKYDTNWGEVSFDGYDFEYYRAGYNYGGLLTLQTFESPFENIQSLEGMIYNVSPIYGMSTIEITYKTISASKKPILRFGKNYLLQDFLEMEIENQSNATYTYNVYDCNFFKIETNKANMEISKIVIKYTGIKTTFDNKYLSSGLNTNRLNPVSYSDVYDGLTVRVPTKVNYNESTYTILEEKEYTYYSYDYISSNTSLADKAAYTDPLDVAIYFNTFKTYPANYVSKRDYRNAYSIFKSNTRCVSNYDRTDGYATNIPYVKNKYTGTPIYYECDIALDDSYSSSNRGSARLVVWLDGFNQQYATNYNDSPVSLYTDDHYSTFSEYLNDGTFGRFFNAEQNSTSFVWGCANTIISQ